MSKNISIAEGGVARQFTNDKLKINLVGGGTEYYVPESGVQLTTKSVTANGTYTAAADDKYGFSQFSVNVRGGNGSADSHGKPTGGDIKPGGAGSAVVGTDPETGEEVAVGVDESGNIVQTPIPYGIKIVTPPTKTDYVYQETIDYTGIGVKLTNKNGDTYTDVDHPSGWYVNPADLIFPVEKAPAGGISISQFLATLQPAQANEQVFFRNEKPGDVPGTTVTMETDVPSYVGILNTGNGYCACAFSSGPFRWRFRSWVNGSQTLTQDAAAQWVVDGLYEYLDSSSTLDLHYFSPDLPIIGVDDIPSSSDYHPVIPVQWVNPYTGETRQDTFEITSTAASGDAHTSTGSSGTEGSGGGGEF